MIDDIQLTRNFIAKRELPDLCGELALRGSGMEASVLLVGDPTYVLGLAARVAATKYSDVNGHTKSLPVHQKVVVRDTGDAIDPLTGEALSPDDLRASLSARYADMLRTAVLHFDGPKPTVTVILEPPEGTFRAREALDPTWRPKKQKQKMCADAADVNSDERPVAQRAPSESKALLVSLPLLRVDPTMIEAASVQDVGEIATCEWLDFSTTPVAMAAHLKIAVVRPNKSAPPQRDLSFLKTRFWTRDPALRLQEGRACSGHIINNTSYAGDHKDQYNEILRVKAPHHPVACFVERTQVEQTGINSLPTHVKGVGAEAQGLECQLEPWVGEAIVSGRQYLHRPNCLTRLMQKTQREPGFLAPGAIPLKREVDQKSAEAGDLTEALRVTSPLILSVRSGSWRESPAPFRSGFTPRSKGRRRRLSATDRSWRRYHHASMSELWPTVDNPIRHDHVCSDRHVSRIHRCTQCVARGPPEKAGWTQLNRTGFLGGRSVWVRRPRL